MRLARGLYVDFRYEITIAAEFVFVNGRTCSNHVCSVLQTGRYGDSNLGAQELGDFIVDPSTQSLVNTLRLLINYAHRLVLTTIVLTPSLVISDFIVKNVAAAGDYDPST